MTILDKGTFMSPEQRAAQEAKIPHSGQTGVEFPVEEFDNTTLNEAVDRGLINIPEGYDPDEPLHSTKRGGGAPHPDTLTTSSTPERKRGWRKIVAVGAAVVVAATGGILAVSNTGNDSQPTLTSETGENPVGTGDVEAPLVDPNTLTAPVISEGEYIVPSVEALQIPSGLSAEEYATQWAALLQSWTNAGAVDELSEYRLDQNVTFTDLNVVLASENTAVYAPAMFGPDWGQNPTVSQAVYSNFEFANRDALNGYTTTQWNTENPNFVEGYTVGYNVIPGTVTSETVSDTERIVTFSVDVMNNSELNFVDMPEMQDGTFTLTLQTSGESEIVSSVVITPIN